MRPMLPPPILQGSLRFIPYRRPRRRPRRAPPSPAAAVSPCGPRRPSYTLHLMSPPLLHVFELLLAIALVLPILPPASAEDTAWNAEGRHGAVTAGGGESAGGGGGDTTGAGEGDGGRAGD